MRDHILALNKSRAVAVSDNWYQVHRLLHDTVGYRVSGTGPEGPARWQFAADPRAIVADNSAASQFILVRTMPEVSSAIEAHSVFSEDTFVPAEGDRVRFYLNVSRTMSRKPGFDRYVRRHEPVPGEHPEKTALKALTHTFIEKAGLELAGELIGPFNRRFQIAKPGDSKPSVSKFAVISSGTAMVRDITKLQSALMSGIGRDRGLGFGILVVEPADAA